MEVNRGSDGRPDSPHEPVRGFEAGGLALESPRGPVGEADPVDGKGTARSACIQLQFVEREDEVELVPRREPALGLMAVQSIGQHRYLPRPKPLGIAYHAASDGLLLTALRILPILQSNELRVQGDDLLVTRSVQDGGQDHGSVIASLLRLVDCAIGAVDLLRGKLAGPIP